MKKERKKIRLQPKQNWDKSLWSIPGWNSKRIRESKVMVVGAGALGNEVIKNLTLLNVGNLVIVDFDIVEYGNLVKSVLFRKENTGQQKALVASESVKLINDQVKVLPILGDIATDVGLGVYRRMDVVIGCLDNRLARLHINQNCFKVGKSWVDGALENLSGNINVYTPGVSCYECTLTDAAKELIRFRTGCYDIAKRNASEGTIATSPLSSSIIGAFQVQEALKIIFGDLNNSMAGQGFRYNGMNNFFLKYRLSEIKEDCSSHVFFEEVIEVEALSHENTISEVLKWIEQYFKTSQPKFLLKENIVLEVITTKTGKTATTAIYKNHLLEAEEIKNLSRAPDEDLHILKSTWIIDRSFPYPKKTLRDLGIPFLEILKVEVNDDIHFIELTGDKNKLTFK